MARRPLPLVATSPDDWSPGEEGEHHGVAFSTVGCRLNQAETEEALDALVARGYRLARDAGAKLVVVNTCAVTRESTATSRKLIRRAIRGHPDATVVVTGCYATAEPDTVTAIPGVDLVVGNHDKERLADLVLAHEPALVATPAEQLVGADADDVDRRLHSRVSIRVQTGCDVHCAFCIIPSTRGPLRSRDAAEVVADLRRRVADGVREAVLTGVHLGRYGHELGDREGLAHLVVRILEQVDGLERLRLSSVLPLEVTPTLVEVMAADDRICRHLHVPLQSGSDRVLARMGRGYDAATFRSRVEHARSRLPHLGLSTDVIVGFPGETREDLDATLAVVEEVGFAKLHVFRYSARPGTRSADTMRDDVTPEEKRARSRELIALGERLRDRFHASLVGAELDVVVEYDRGRAEPAAPAGSSAASWLQGTAGNYVKVAFRGDPSWVEHVVRVRLTGLRGAIMAGEAVGVSGASQERRESRCRGSPETATQASP
ncbi:MAG TPA: tRNA (N(6)-L-threonylcarbamoyladenosine(37)-C(2))-methylthiotransferase MtaB [Nitriliruptorales bacterium]|nr:tRNA (N(6)-L-threonylcarbamoyladenosine(37)-C(2))-methylthiotransferase MtaB [Nitriliruptorales bacterium]